MADNYFMLMNDGVWEEVSEPHVSEVNNETICPTVEDNE